MGGPTTATPAYIPGSRTNGPISLTPVPGTLNLLANPSSGATWVTFRTGAAAGFVASSPLDTRDSGLPYSSTGLFQVVAWKGAFATWTDAFAAYQAGTPGVGIGASNPMVLTVTTNLTDMFIPSLQGLESFSIQLVPEPTSIGLLGTGLATIALMAFARRTRGRKTKLKT